MSQSRCLSAGSHRIIVISDSFPRDRVVVGYENSESGSPGEDERAKGQVRAVLVIIAEAEAQEQEGNKAAEWIVFMRLNGF